MDSLAPAGLSAFFAAAGRRRELMVAEWLYVCSIKGP